MLILYEERWKACVNPVLKTVGKINQQCTISWWNVPLPFVFNKGCNKQTYSIERSNHVVTYLALVVRKYDWVWIECKRVQF